MERQRFTAHGRDLFFDLPCTCPNERFKDSPVAHLMTHTVKLTGYADDNFFDNVNPDPRILACKCGREFSVQWFRDGIEAEFLDQQPPTPTQPTNNQG